MKNRHPILLVDDEPEILFSLRGLLRHDFEVHTAPGGAEALAILRQHPVHVIMTDQRMPGMTGVELLRRAREECPEAVRIVFTGYADIKAVVDAINEGQIYRYLTKPWDPGELVELLRQACEHYERVAERRRLLLDLKEHLRRCQEVLPSLPSSEAQPLIEAGAALLARLERAFAGVPQGD